MDDPKRTIVLVGLMGSGKSTVGKRVGASLGWPFIDVDDVIEAETGQTVGELWEQGGEAAYRPLERRVVLDALDQEAPVVLAAPGGVIDDGALVARLEGDDVFVVFLRGHVDTLARRIGADDQERPLVGDDPRAVLVEQAADRNPRYARLADITLDPGDRSADEVAAIVGSSLTSGPPDGGV